MHIPRLQRPDFDRSQSLTNLEDFDSSYLSVFDQDLCRFQGNFLTQNPITKTEGMLTTLGNQFGDATMTTGSFSTLSLMRRRPSECLGSFSKYYSSLAHLSSRKMRSTTCAGPAERCTVPIS